VDSILIFGDTVRCPELRVEVPDSVADPSSTSSGTAIATRSCGRSKRLE
jgi:hypothetical protein